MSAESKDPEETVDTLAIDKRRYQGPVVQS